MIDTYSANSLKILNENPEEFKKKYIDNLSLYQVDKRAYLGQKYHSLICSFIKGYDIKKFEKVLTEREFENWKILKNKIKTLKGKFIQTEYPFLIKNCLENKSYYLTGRFDAVYKENDTITIYDWKTLNIPETPSKNIQTIVYLYCAGKIFNSTNIKMKYIAIEKQTSNEILYECENIYKNKIEEIIKKLDKPID